MKPLTLPAAILLVFTLGLSGGCANRSGTYPSAATSPEASSTPRPYSAPLREFQDPSAAR
ncbi:MAG: hypothetical protein JO015_15230 [Verrucomicrobia bacterium]|nr:hypothetical protein [Verrucomicrobiota bacterium]